MINYIEFYVLLLLLPVMIQIIIPLIMLPVYLLVKSGSLLNSLFAKSSVAMDQDRNVAGIMKT